MVVGQRIQRCLGLASSLENPLHCRRREGTESHGPLQSRENVLTRVGGREREDSFRLALAIAGAGQQALQKATA